MNVYTWRIIYNCLDTSGLKKYHNFLMLLSKIAEIYVWSKLKSYKKAPISAQILSAIKSNRDSDFVLK